MKHLQKILVGIFAIGLIAGFSANAAFAEAPNGRVSEDVPEPEETTAVTTNYTNASDGARGGETSETEEAVEPISEENTDETELIEPISDEGVEIIETTEEESVDSAPEMWPVYLSIGGIILTLLLIFVINIIHRKSKK